MLTSETGDRFLAAQARLAQSVEHETLNLRVVGSSPTLGAYIGSGAFYIVDFLG